MTAIQEQPRQPLWKTNPSPDEVRSAYTQPSAPEHWGRIDEILTHGFATKEQGIAWPNRELQRADNEVFIEVTDLVISTLQLTDAEFTSFLPQIFKRLEKTYLFGKLFEVMSETQKNSVRHHIEMVPSLLDTQGVSIRDKFILRMTALFHDTGKAFDIGRDQLHYHALIAATILKQFFIQNKPALIHRLHQYEIRSQERILLSKDFLEEKGGMPAVVAEGVTAELKTELSVGFDKLSSRTTELIRVHHVLEQIDKKQLDLATVAELFAENGINPMLVGLFVVADGTSVVPDNEKYAEFLIENLNILAQIIDLLENEDELTQLVENKPETVQVLQESLALKEIYVQALIHVIEKIVAIVADLPSKVKEIVSDLIERLDAVLAQALFSYIEKPA